MKYLRALLLSLIAALPAAAFSQTIVFNEIMYHPTSTNLLEDFIELYNPASTNVDLTNWKISKGVQFTFPSNTLISAKGYLVVAADRHTFTNKYPAVANFVAGWTGKLSRSGEEILLEDAAGQTINDIYFASEGDWGIRRLAAPDTYGKVGWEWFAEHDGSGKTLELINPALPNSYGQNWGSSTPLNGTPGQPNSIARTNIAPIIANVAHYPIIPKSTDPVTITARIVDEHANGLTVTLFWRIDSTTTTNSLTMFDDGAHGDGVANDGIYGAVLNPMADAAIVEFFIQARDLENNSRTFPNVQNPGTTRTANPVFQVDNSVYSGVQPIYRIIMPNAEYSYLQTQVWNGSVDSDAEVSGTFVSIDGIVDDGVTTKYRYSAGFRNRGHGSRNANPHNFRVNFPVDNLWKKRSAINLNTQYTQCQLIGSALFRSLGIPMADSRPVQVRVNAANLANSGPSQFGSYEANEEVNSDFASENFPLDDQGNLYRGIRDQPPGASADFNTADLACSTPTTCYTNEYYKQNNTLENDYSDLIDLIQVMNPSTPAQLAAYTNEIRRVANVDEWMKYLAINTILVNMETSLGTGYGDDYAMYRGVVDKRFLLLSYDMDTIMGSGDAAGSTTASLFRMNVIPAIDRMVTNATILPLYYGHLRELCENEMAPANMNLFLDRLRTEYDGNSQLDTVIAQMKTFNAARTAYVLTQIPQTLTVSSPLTVQSGYPHTTLSTTPLFGQADAVNTRSVLVNGATANWDPRAASWTNSSVSLRPGINRVLVQSLNGAGQEFARTNIDIWYDDSTVATATINVGSNYWSAAGGPYLLSSSATLPAGSIIRIQAGTTVYFAAGATLTVNGQLLAEGTDTAHIRFTRSPGGANWGSLDFINTTVESRLAYADFEFCGGATTSDGHTAQVHVNSSIVFIDHCTWPSTPVQEYISFNGSSFIVQNCTFPSYPPPSGPESLHGINGIPNGGYGIFRDNYFGHTWGFNDTIDFTGGNRPGPILQIINNIFDGASDDCLDLDSTDAWIEGNIFMHVHRDPARTDDSRDTGSAISGGVDTVGQNSDWTIINNIFYDVDHVFLNKGPNSGSNGGGRVALLYNTVIHVNKEYSGSPASDIAAFDWSDDGVALPDATIGAGLYAAYNIIYDCTTLQKNYDPAHHTVILDNNILYGGPSAPASLTWSGAGSGNQVLDPMLNLGALGSTAPTNVTVAQLRQAAQLRPGSPAVGAGFGGLNLGGFQPHGITVSGEPPSVTSSTSATLTLGPSGTFNWGTTTPQAWGWTAYKWKLDNGAYSAEVPVSNNSPFTNLPTINLSNLPNGPHTVYVVGKNDAPPGYYQDDTFVYPAALPSDATNHVSARVTASKTWTVNTNLSRVLLNEVLAKNVKYLSNSAATPDLIEIYNPTRNAIDLGGMGLTDNASDPYKFIFPSPTLLASGGYLVLYSDSGSGGSYLHTGFGLKDTSDDLSLFDTVANGGTLIDAVTFGTQIPDFSIGRLADGTWGLCKPTFGSANISVPVGNGRSLKINEWLADAQFVAAHDFVELYNPDPVPTLLSGLYLSDASGTPNRNLIPALSFIAPSGFASFIADGDPQQGANHLNFHLSPDVGMILLSAADLTPIDVIIYGPQTTDISQGRTPSGGNTIASFGQVTEAGPNPGPRGGTGSVTNITRTVVNLLSIPTSSWKYNDTGVDLGTAWQASGYIDTTWSNGFGLFGFDTTPSEYLPNTFQTYIPPPQSNGHWTVYYRTHFTWSNALAGFSLISTNYVDDGFLIYLNGAFANGARLTQGATYTTPASNQGSEGTPDILTFPNPPVVGDNVLAVEVHQNTCCGGTTSSDDVFGMNLAAVASVTNIITTTLGFTPVLLNEILASNQTLTNSDGRTSDWIELYNPATNSVDLGDASLSDDPNQPRKWVFPTNSVIAAKGYLVVYCDPSSSSSSSFSPSMNTGFGISAQGESLFLFEKPANGGGLLDSVTFGLQTPDFGIGHIPSGTGAWVLTVPTRGTANAAAGLGSPSLLRVNEWMANPSSGDDWFEIYNSGSSPVALGGLFLTDDLTDRTQSPIQPLSFIGSGGNGYIQFIADGHAENGANHVSFKLNNGGEQIGIFSPSGTLLNGITFTAQTKGISQGRFPDGASAITNFPTTASPAESNYLPIPNVVINELLSHTDPPLEDAIEFYNPTATGTNIGNWFLSNSKLNFKKYRVTAGTTLAGNGYLVLYQYQFGDTNSATGFTFNSAEGDDAILSAADAGGNLTGYRVKLNFGSAENAVSFGRYQTSVGFDFTAMSQRTFGVDNPADVTQFRTGTGLTNAYPKIGPVVINEIMYHPISGSGANIVEEPEEEFLELRNITGGSVPLFDPSYPTNTWKLDEGVHFQFPTNITVAAGAHILVVSFNPAIDTAALASFRAKYGVSNTVPIFGPWTGRLDNSGEAIELYKPDAVQLPPHPDAGFVPYILVDRVRYANALPWPTNSNGTGASLQRIFADKYGNDPANWGTGSPTAGRINYSDTDGDGMPDDWEIAFALNRFNPADALGDSDGDGMLNIDEYRAGTDPNNATSNLRILSQSAISSNFILQFNGVAGKSYSVIYRTNVVSGTWTSLGAINPAVNGPINVTNFGINDLPLRTYRVVTPSR